MSITQIVRNVFTGRMKTWERYATHAEEMQQQALSSLLHAAKDTEYGRKHLFANCHNYDTFAHHVPVNTYEELKEDIDRMRHG